MPFTAPISSGEGSRSQTASSSLWTPLFLNAEPHNVGMKEFSKQARRIESNNSAGDMTSSARYFSINTRSFEATSSSK